LDEKAAQGVLQVGRPSSFTRKILTLLYTIWRYIDGENVLQIEHASLTLGIDMHTTLLATFLETSRTAVSMCGAGILLFPIGLWAAKTNIAAARGLDKIVVLSNLCFAIPLAVFGAEHLSGARSIMLGVPSYIPWRLFWAYFVGFALVAASLSIATKIQVHWSGLLFGILRLLLWRCYMSRELSPTPETGLHG
jgi:hypothetical protein